MDAELWASASCPYHAEPGLAGLVGAGQRVSRPKLDALLWPDLFILGGSVD